MPVCAIEAHLLRLRGTQRTRSTTSEMTNPDGHRKDYFPDSNRVRALLLHLSEALGHSIAPCRADLIELRFRNLSGASRAPT